MPRIRTKFKQRQHLKSARKQRKFLQNTNKCKSIDESSTMINQDFGNCSNNNIQNDILPSLEPQIEINAHQERIDRLLEYAIDLPESTLIMLINIIKKLSQLQLH